MLLLLFTENVTDLLERVGDLEHIVVLADEIELGDDGRLHLRLVVGPLCAVDAEIGVGVDRLALDIFGVHRRVHHGRDVTLVLGLEARKDRHVRVPAAADRPRQTHEQE